MITRFIGDVHGKFGKYKTVLADSPHPTIQVGDLGVGFRKWPHGEPSANPPYDAMVAGGHRFIRGNHDSPTVCARHTQWIADGTVENGTMFIGGGLSIDRAYRIEDYSWWPDEELPAAALSTLVDIYMVAKPDVMVTHECPERIAEMIVGRLANLATPGQRIKLDPRFASRTREFFDQMLRTMHKPKLWIFGHWHVPFDETIAGTRFICLPELAFVDIDLAGV